MSNEELITRLTEENERHGGGDGLARIWAEVEKIAAGSEAQNPECQKLRLLYLTGYAMGLRAAAE